MYALHNFEKKRKNIVSYFPVIHLFNCVSMSSTVQSIGNINAYNTSMDIIQLHNTNSTLCKYENYILGWM